MVQVVSEIMGPPTSVENGSACTVEGNTHRQKIIINVENVLTFMTLSPFEISIQGDKSLLVEA
jgi:hypothetical protein